MTDEAPRGGWWRSADGRIRSGWVVLVFTVVAVVSASAFQGAIWVLDLFPDEPYSLSDPKIALSPWSNLISGGLATLVAWQMGQDAGFKRRRLVLLGAVGAAALVSVTVAVGGLVSGSVGIAVCSNKLLSGFLQLAFIGPTAIGEELWMRGAGFRALARGTHPAVAITVTGVVFGALHLTNPDATAIAALNVALVGIWFGALAWRTQSLWPAIGAHLAWNWFEGFVWGQNVSGIQAGCSLLTATSHGPFWSGGGFGPEASGLTAVLLAIASGVTLLMVRRSPAEAEPTSPEPLP